MKIKSLLLGSVALVGTSAAASAADLSILTSLDVCDELGITGLTISSDSNCLAISGGVAYTFSIGDWDGSTAFGIVDWPGTGTDIYATPTGDGNLDWYSEVSAWLQFVGTADSDFGPASATIIIEYTQFAGFTNSSSAPLTTGGPTTPVITGSGTTFTIDEAFVSVGDSTVLTAGKTGSIFNDGDDEPLNWLGLFGADVVDEGVTDSLGLNTGGHVIQLTSDLGDGFSVGVAAEDLAGTGSLVGVMAYDGDGITAHISVVAGDLFIGAAAFAVHAGATFEYDMFTFGGAVAADDTGFWNVLGTASATFDMFTIAASAEATSVDGWGVGGSISADVIDGVTLNVGGRYWEDASADGIYEIAVGVDADVTETVSLSGQVGFIADNGGAGLEVFYVEGGVTWAPGGGFEAEVSGRANSESAYEVAFTASKDFE